MKLTTMMSTMLTSSLLLAGLTTGSPAFADDGAINNKSMSKQIQVPLFDQPIVDNAVSEAEHAFTDMMKFYVPSQAASGLIGPIAYCDIDNEPASGEDCLSAVETLEVAKPLVNVFIYGPSFHVEGTAFAHRFFDTYAAVSLDDGETFKQTNLSESADLSSFNLDTDHVPNDGHTHEPEQLPANHDVLLGDAWHAPGYETPYDEGCTDCHGLYLDGGVAQACSNCHEEPAWEGPPTITEASWEDGDGGKLAAKGTANSNALVEVINAVTKEVLATDTASEGGEWEIEETNLGTAPCTIAAVADGAEGASVVPEGTPEDCEGEPLDVTDYPGGTYNVFHATAGNKTLVAWPSRFCSSGQPAYSFAYDADPDEDPADLQVIKRNEIAAHLGIDVTTDLYLADLFGVGGAQGSIDFADEEYPQAGVVPFGCVWTSRGVLLAGDDPRTDEVEASHMVWTKAERLTSGRRDPNRIEVRGVQGAGFVITWQEDPDGLRPGQGLGPGEGWSGAVAHSKTDVWYSFLPWEHFDTVEGLDETSGATVPINIVDHDLTVSGRPQVYVPMAVPMRLTNNDKCGAEYFDPGITDPTDNKYFSYCNDVVADAYGLQNFCVDTVDIPQGSQDELGPICVNEDGLPNLANTASTRPRTSLQGYDSDGDEVVDSAWVIVAAEESKGLGRYQFLPDGTPCDEDAADASPDCTSDIGKNQWYFSFDMGDPATSVTATQPNGLVQNLVKQGNLLNQPEADWRTGEFYPVINTLEMWDFGSYNYDVYNTEIARRSSLLVQSIDKALGSDNDLLAISSWKQGAMRQGGPADTMLRRIVLPEGYGTDPAADTDGDGVLDCEDFCTLVANPGQEDTDGDGYGNICDGDLDNSFGVVNFADLAIFKLVYGTVYLDADFDSSGGVVNFGDLAIFKQLYGSPPGPSCIDTGDCTCPAAVAAAALPGIETNPYAFENMVCDDWLIEPDTNPYYPGGICGAPATNLSGVVPDTCKDDSDGTTIDCPTVDFTGGSTYGIGDTNPILQGYEQGEGNTQRVLTWHQCPSDGVAQDTSEIGTVVTCDTDDRTDAFVNLADQSWYNPLDVSKGHRGFIDGDFVMFLYAWSPNWRLNAKGNDRYDLYVRRSFDGGETWQTTPSSFLASDEVTYNGDGTVTCETYRSTETGVPEATEPHVCYDFGPGVNEHARNITQHQRMQITTLDPRYAPTPASIADGCVDADDPTIDELVMTCDDLSVELDSDLRIPSRYFMVYETGDNSTVQAGEAEPLNLFYGRAESFGDDYVVWAETDTATADPTVCYPNDAHGDEKVIGTVVEESGFCNEFDRMNRAGDTHSSEANLEANPDASKMYGVWAQWVFDASGEEIAESDAMARRIWWIDDYICDVAADSTCAWSLPGTNQQ